MFQVGDKVRLVSNPRAVKNIRPDWVSTFLMGSDKDGVFKVEQTNTYHNIQVLRLGKVKGRCYQEYWVPHTVFVKYHADWLDELPIG